MTTENRNHEPAGSRDVPDASLVPGILPRDVDTKSAALHLWDAKAFATIGDCWRAAFGREIPDRDGLHALETDSVCGMDCALAIAAAVPLLLHVQRAHGDHPAAEYDREAIADAVLSVCKTYFYG